jgi:autophagy-related protein 17
MTNAAVKSSLPQPNPLPPIDKILSSQKDVSVDMARHLESLVAHYAQMAAALKDSEAGETFSEEDLQGNVAMGPGGPCRPEWLMFRLAMNRDANELQFIIMELEDSLKVIEDSQ